MPQTAGIRMWICCAIIRSCLWQVWTPGPQNCTLFLNKQKRMVRQEEPSIRRGKRNWITTAFLRNAFTFFANLENYAALFALDEFTIRMLPLEKLCGIETLDAAARQEQVNELAETAELAEPQEIFGDYEGQAFDDWSFDSKAETFSALTALLPITVPWCRTLNISNGIYLITPFPQGMEDVDQWISIVHKNARSLAETVYPDEFPDQQEKDMISLRREPKEPENERYEEDL